MSIKLSNVVKSFGLGGKVKAVNGINLNIQPGEVVALLGPNGAGKTTTIDMILGLTEPTEGKIEVLGASPRSAVVDGKISALLQTGGLLRDMRVGEAVDYIAATYHKETLSRAALERAGISHLAQRKIAKCSGGEQQRLKFALALLPNPELLILDEPTTGMDITGRREFWASMREEATAGRTVVFATHYLEEAQDFADRIVLMNHGKIISDGSVSEIRNITGQRRVTWIQDGESHTALSPDSDAFARELLATPGVHSLEIAAPSLDDAFVSLTSENAS
ncbi:ABC-2 type transport system ATP-binding protein [Arcanobacterium pluranimalium]|uniref:ABC transporter ATP-binding protein n=1 Tax=Arcanobacterium pluranimalium TaxID=108028 RepID=UPI001EF8D93C|nr:ABC transporter ATP-binding protein [Arcanobacterium pluranimalium]MBM7824739.1 ABC-2 type transport system ATP-binding protein [Arcanobacterium pluranimalium]